MSIASATAKEGIELPEDMNEESDGYEEDAL